MYASLREADLEAPIYNQFLKSVHELSLSLGGNNAPFQYILTTTSDPPQALKNDRIIRLELRAHPEKDMLFGRILEPPGLFDGKNRRKTQTSKWKKMNELSAFCTFMVSLRFSRRILTGRFLFPPIW